MPHTADVRIEAWAPTREGCIAEAVRGLVETFADTTGCEKTATREYRVTGESDEDLLVGVLDEVIYRLDTAGEVPAAAVVQPAGDGVVVRLTMVDAGSAGQVGAVPKAVSLHELRFDAGPAGWICSVTIDV